MKFINTKSILSLYSTTKKIHNNKKIKDFISKIKINYLLINRKSLKNLVFNTFDISDCNSDNLIIDNCIFTNNIIISNNKLRKINIINSEVFGKLLISDCSNLDEIYLENIISENIYIDETAICNSVNIIRCGLKYIPLNISNKKLGILDLSHNNITISEPLYLSPAIVDLRLNNNNIENIEIYVYGRILHLLLHNNRLINMKILIGQGHIYRIYISHKLFKEVDKDIIEKFD